MSSLMIAESTPYPDFDAYSYVYILNFNIVRGSMLNYVIEIMTLLVSFLLKSRSSVFSINSHFYGGRSWKVILLMPEVYVSIFCCNMVKISRTSEGFFVFSVYRRSNVIIEDSFVCYMVSCIFPFNNED